MHQISAVEKAAGVSPTAQGSVPALSWPEAHQFLLIVFATSQEHGMQIGQFCSRPSASARGHCVLSVRVIHGENLSWEAKQKLQFRLLCLSEARTI